MFRAVRFLLVLAAATSAWVASGSVACAADGDAPDKIGYTLFNPTPDAAMRDFSTDRPPKANSPYTVDAGHAQYEGDLVSFLYDHYSPGGTTTRQWVVADPTFKLGLTNTVDGELQLAPYTNLRTTVRGARLTSQADGFGDLIPRLKVNLLGDDGGDQALALIPYVKLPTAERGLGNNRVEGGVIAPLSLSLPDHWTAILMTEIDALADASGPGRHANFLNLVNLSHGLLIEGLTGYVELFADTASGGQVAPVYTLDLALTYLITPTLQLDIGSNIGLNKAAPDLQTYVGLSQRF
jgi:hypothetical protein